MTKITKFVTWMKGIFSFQGIEGLKFGANPLGDVPTFIKHFLSNIGTTAVEQRLNQPTPEQLARRAEARAGGGAGTGTVLSFNPIVNLSVAGTNASADEIAEAVGGEMGKQLRHAATLFNNGEVSGN